MRTGGNERVMVSKRLGGTARRGLDHAAAHSRTVGRGALAAKLRALLPTSWELRLAAALPPGQVALDVGAHIGLYSALLASRFDQVVAFEPHPACVGRLLGTMPANVAVVSAAAGDRCGLAALHVPVVDHRPISALGSLRALPAPARTSTVPVVTLDQFELGSVGFVKVDVEGSELEVLRGAAGLLAAGATWLIESEERHRPGAPAAVIGHLLGAGYAGRFVVDRRVLPVERFDPGLHQRSVPGPDGAVRSDYACNFVFAPADRIDRWDLRLRALVGGGS
jgi:FkbM family methyltransferase